MISEAVFESFFNKVATRLKRYQNAPNNLITEDCIRYDFYATLLQYFASDDLITEYPHDHELLKRKEIDLVVNNDAYTAIFEFKYYRKIPSQKEDRTSRLASIYIDIIKLKLSSISINKFFVLLTDQVMYKYILNNGYEYIFSNQQSTPFDFYLSPKHLEGKHFNNQAIKKLGKDHNFNELVSLSKVYENNVTNTYLYIYKVH